ncbi:2-keto-4-pentenoate hydratase [Peristeroidobacter soli]|jgi:2-keto-4-pentenoate hydratase|uniref:2-keto-4-pentenoate hydratase n=1 Tax=Peristeroidobacter soli TaxID=2497877 RepID=UPI00101B7CA1|nr:2-keto-4-pentenoate hydratase [Peristeroidobacter soli]
MSSAVLHGAPAGAEMIAEQFVRARLAGQSLPQYPGALPTTLAEAYRCQEFAIERFPDRIVGWKVARIGAAFAQQFPEERLVGPVFERNLHTARVGQVVEFPVIEGGFGAVEAEIVLCVDEDAPADKKSWSIDEAAEMVRSFHLGVETAVSPLATLNDLGPGAVISDFGNNWGVIVGASIGEWRSIDEIVALTFIEDGFVGRGTAFIRQGALGALAFALSKCAERGRPLRAGDFISTGAITGVHDIRAGQHSRLVFEGCGEVECRAVRAGPYLSRAAL